MTIPMTLSVVVAFLGVMVGSFCNVCILRIPLGEGVVMGHSHCMNCEKELKWWELIPLFSWIFLRGKCSKCKHPISVQYPLIEFANGVLWGVVCYVYGYSVDTALGCLLLSALLVLSVIDARTKEIPPQTTIFIFFLGVVRFVINIENWQDHLLGLVGVAGVLLILLLISGGSAIGGGDVKLMAGCGLFLGLTPTIFAFLLGCIIASVIHVIRMRCFGAGRELALGPYLAVGVCIAFLWGETIISWYFTRLGF